MTKKLWQFLSYLIRLEYKPVVSVVCFHRVLSDPDFLRPGEPTASEFELLIGTMRKHFDILHLRHAPEYVRTRKCGHGLVLTFDDGYEDNFALAAPILEMLNVPATFFVTTGTLDRGCMWNDYIIESARVLGGGEFSWETIGLKKIRVRSNADRVDLVRQILPRIKYRPPSERQDLALEFAELAGLSAAPDFMMTRQEVDTLDRHALFEIGAHTVNHPILASIPETDARREIVDGKEGLESILGRKVDLFAYPNGMPGTDYRVEHVAMVREAGFKLAVTTSTGGARKTAFPLEWPRQSVWQKRPGRASLSLIRGSRDEGDVLER